jgi:PKHD-type hydroxylase
MNYEILQNAVVFRNVFDDLAWFIDNQKEKTLIDSGIIRSNNAGYDKDFRYSTQANVSSENPVVERVRQLKKYANETYFKINISQYSKENHFVQYDVDGKFDAHTDIIWRADVDNLDKNPVRKITCVTLLNDDFTGGKLALWYTGQRYSFPFNKGDVIMFPSYVQHKVDPVESGVRYSLVSWSYGEF